MTIQETRCRFARGERSSVYGGHQLGPGSGGLSEPSLETSLRCHHAAVWNLERRMAAALQSRALNRDQI
jgi:hypothetical protein